MVYRTAPFSMTLDDPSVMSPLLFAVYVDDVAVYIYCTLCRRHFTIDAYSQWASESPKYLWTGAPSVRLS